MFGLGDAFKKPEGVWDCDVCLLQNKAADVQCVACQAAKPGANVEPKGKKNDLLLGLFNNMLKMNDCKSQMLLTKCFLMHSIYKYSNFYKLGQCNIDVT